MQVACWKLGEVSAVCDSSHAAADDKEIHQLIVSPQRFTLRSSPLLCLLCGLHLDFSLMMSSPSDAEIGF